MSGIWENIVKMAHEDFDYYYGLHMQHMIEPGVGGYEYWTLIVIGFPMCCLTEKFILKTVKKIKELYAYLYDLWYHDYDVKL